MSDNFEVQERPSLIPRNPRQGDNSPYAGIDEVCYHVVDKRTGDSVGDYGSREEAEEYCAHRNNTF